MTLSKNGSRNSIIPCPILFDFRETVKRSADARGSKKGEKLTKPEKFVPYPALVGGVGERSF
ncbi:MAG: hypothetical protein LBF22_09200 [Deltaproteobacteria bacterium]|nr:hypothetical protein [Deltaproteobacteria bacterium]